MDFFGVSNRSKPAASHWWCIVDYQFWAATTRSQHLGGSIFVSRSCPRRKSYTMAVNGEWISYVVVSGIGPALRACVGEGERRWHMRVLSYCIGVPAAAAVAVPFHCRHVMACVCIEHACDLLLKCCMHIHQMVPQKWSSGLAQCTCSRQPIQNMLAHGRWGCWCRTEVAVVSAGCSVRPARRLAAKQCATIANRSQRRDRKGGHFNYTEMCGHGDEVYGNCVNVACLSEPEPFWQVAIDWLPGGNWRSPAFAEFGVVPAASST